MMVLQSFLVILFSLACISPLLVSCDNDDSSFVESVIVDPKSPLTPLPHFWSKMFGSGRANLVLRERYQQDLKDMRMVVNMEYARFHGILHDENGVYNEDENGKPVYDYTYVDQIYDALLANGVRPFLEISFMPKKLASNSSSIHPFWYHPNVSPPKSYEIWNDLIFNFASHLIDRYGIDEVSQWYFEVWNEPNIDFWQGKPKQQTYFTLFENTAKTLKSVDKRLRVGGPASAAAGWIPEFLDFVGKSNTPIDFVSSHGYADDTVENLFNTTENIPMEYRVCLAIKKVKNEILNSTLPELPLMWTEWSVPSFGDLNGRDKSYVAAGVAENIYQCDGFVDMMSFWTFTDVFEEDGVRSEPLDGSFGVIAEGGIKKPSYYGFGLLDKLGEQRITPKNASQHVLLTYKDNGSIVIAAWNLVSLYNVSTGVTKSFQFKVENFNQSAIVEISRVDENFGNVEEAYKSVGSPIYPTKFQIDKMNKLTQLPPPQTTSLVNGILNIDVPVNGLAVITIHP